MIPRLISIDSPNESSRMKIKSDQIKVFLFLPPTFGLPLLTPV